MTKYFLNKAANCSKAESIGLRWYMLIAPLLLSGLSLGYGQDARLVAFNSDTDFSLCINCSPDGKNVYAGGERTLAVFERLENGGLRTAQVFNNHHEGVEHVEHIIDIVITPDGRHVYALSIVNQALLLYARDTTAGALSLVEVFHDSVFASRYGFPAIEEDYELLVSPDGLHLYWLYQDLGVLAVFERDSESGRITKVQVLRNGDPSLVQLTVPTSLAIAPDGEHLYGPNQNGYVLTFVRNEETGKIALQNSYPTNITWWPKSSIAVLPDGAWVCATSFDESKLIIFQRDVQNGRITLFQELFQHPAPLALLPSPQSSQVYVGRNGDLALVARNLTSGQFEFVSAVGAAFTFPAGITISPDGEEVFTTYERYQWLTIYQRELTTGKLAILQRRNHNLGGTDRLYTSHAVEVSPEGAHLYVAAREPARGIGDAGVSLFKRNQSEGRITFAAFDTLTDIGGMLLSPEGQHLYVQSAASNAVHVFARDSQTGVLQMTQTVQPLPKTRDTILYTLSPGMMAFSDEGEHFYFNTSEHLLVYDRETSTGQLTLQQTVQIDDHQLGSKSAFALSPEGTHVYWGGYERNVSLHNPRYEMAILARDPASGLLTFLKRTSFEGMFPGYTIKVSRDGRHVYAGLLAANYEQNTGEMLGVFARDPQSGELRLQEVMRYSGYENCVDLAIAPNDSDVYAVFDDPGWSGSALAMFERDRATGKLQQRKLFRSWREGVYGLYDPVDFSLSPDGRFIYIADLQGVVTFATGRENTTAVHGNETFASLPRALTLEQNYPNPFSSSSTPTAQHTTIIHYEIAATQSNAQPVELTIYNTQGQLVNTLVHETQTSGKHEATWNGANAQGWRVPAGVYFYRLKMGEQVATKKMVVVQ